MTFAYHPRAAELADYLRQRRAVLRVGAPTITKRGGPSGMTIQRYESGNIPERINVETLTKIDTGYGLKPGTARFILDPDVSFLDDLSEALISHLAAAEAGEVETDSWRTANTLLRLMLEQRRRDRFAVITPAATVDDGGFSRQGE